jgi:hypothetical protein
VDWVRVGRSRRRLVGGLGWPLQPRLGPRRREHDSTTLLPHQIRGQLRRRRCPPSSLRLQPRRLVRQRRPLLRIQLRRRHRPRRHQQRLRPWEGRQPQPAVTHWQTRRETTDLGEAPRRRPLSDGAGPNTWDCSSFTQAAYAQIGVKIPRTATAQRNWLATGNGTRIQPGQEKPGDLIFWDSYRGPNRIGHVMIIWNLANKTTIEARGTRAGVKHLSYANGRSHHIFEIWRVGNLGGGP